MDKLPHPRGSLSNELPSYTTEQTNQVAGSLMEERGSAELIRGMHLMNNEYIFD